MKDRRHALAYVFAIKAGRPRYGVQRYAVRAQCTCGRTFDAEGSSSYMARRGAKWRLDTHVRWELEIEQTAQERLL